MPSLGGVVAGIVGGLAEPIAGVVRRREDRKQARESGDAKLALARQQGDVEVTLTDAEWEAQTVRGMDESYKDEAIVGTFLALVWLMIVGALAYAFGEPRILDGAKLAAAVLVQDLGLDLEFLMNAVVLAGLGLKVWRGR